MNSLRKGAEKVVRECLNIKSSEKVLIVTDTRMKKFGEVLFGATKEITTKTNMIVIKPTGRHGAEPPKKVANMMKKVDVVIAPTYFSLTHTKARRDACKASARVATMPQVREFSFTKGGLTADYKRVKDLTEKMYNAMKRVKIIRVKAPNGTDVSFSVEGREWYEWHGVYHKSRDYGNLPEGEVCAAPLEGSVNGVVVFDSSRYGKAKLIVKNGFVEKVINSKKLVSVFKELGRRARNIAEIGIGTNPKAKIIGNVLEDEKVFGTVHMALGNNMSFGGSVNIPFHEDGIITKPTLITDNKIIIKDGKWII